MIAQEPGIRHEGQHDFDFFMGSWHVHNRRLKNPLAGSNEWYEFEGTCTARPIWKGKAHIDEAVFASPLARIEGCSIRFYDTQTRLWSIYWSTAKTGLLTLPTVGAFTDDGVGEFFDRETHEGKEIVCRFRWSDITAQSCRWEQAFSVDDGVSWEPNWIMEFTRI